MKLEDQVCTLKQAERLKELGVIQVSLFDWCVFMPDPTGEKYFYAVVYKEQNTEKQLHEWIASAFTVAELGEINKEDIRTYKTDGYWCAYIPTEEGFRLHANYFKTEAELRADILIKSLEL
jgi:hypothetical protein